MAASARDVGALASSEKLSKRRPRAGRFPARATLVAQDPLDARRPIAKLFDRSRATSLRCCLEHVHGESQHAGRRWLRLMAVQRHGLLLDSHELPDLAAIWRYLAQLPEEEALGRPCDVAIWSAQRVRLQ